MKQSDIMEEALARLPGTYRVIRVLVNNITKQKEFLEPSITTISRVSAKGSPVIEYIEKDAPNIPIITKFFNTQSESIVLSNGLQGFKIKLDFKLSYSIDNNEIVATGECFYDKDKRALVTYRFPHHKKSFSLSLVNMDEEADSFIIGTGFELIVDETALAGDGNLQ